AGDSSVVRSAGYDVEQGTVLVDPDELGLDGVTSDIDGKTVTVAVGGETLTLETVGSRDVPAGTALVSGADGRTLDAAAGDAVEQQTWVRSADDASTARIEGLSSEVHGIGADSDVEVAQNRAEYASMLQVALTVVLVLLAAAVIIAVIGVSNTLTMSVIDRRREGALLRALGCNRGSMSRMITIRSEEHTSESSHVSISYAVFCLKKKKIVSVYMRSTTAE